jgi:branched-chain amino acid transport system permease protein
MSAPPPTASLPRNLSVDRSKLLVVIAAFAALAAWPFMAGAYGVDLVAKIMIYAIFALSLELLVG